MNNPPLTAKAVFDHAHEITSPAERQAYLDQACASDSELRQKVEALLQAYDAIRSRSFLQTPAVPLGDTGPYQRGSDAPGQAPSFEAVTVPPQPSTEPASQIEGPGTQIGPYKLIKELGEGGMGAVYLAEQEQPIRRQVALKIIKPGMDSAAIVARFEAERQALTMMDHPHIARVFEAGTTAAGRPYFVMELVGGIPMTRFCNDNKLTVRERLELFASVCEAIQHAHAKGVMHRDIKPGNVLVALQDGKPAPKVIDFGLAKAIGQPLTDETQLTQLGAIVGTPEYMSPEQADPTGPGVDTATDIYSLGVMLYELLTGTTPLDLARTRGEGGVLDLLMRIHTEEPPRPSDRVAALADRLPGIAEKRKIEPARLAKLLRGELDWIALRALEKDRKRRYETASAFGRDVQRYLSDEPVEACPPTVGYRVGKFVRRNRVLVGAASVVGALLLVLVVGLWVTVIRERDLRDQAETAEKKAQTTLDMTDNALEVTNWLNRPKLGYGDKLILRDRLQRIRQLSRETAVLQEGTQQLAESYYRQANLALVVRDRAAAESNLRTAIQEYEKLVTASPAVAQHRIGLVRSISLLAFLFLGSDRFQEATAAYHRLIELHGQLAAEFPTEQSYRSDLADDHYDLGGMLRELKEPAKAQDHFRQAIDLREKLVDYPDDLVYRYKLAIYYLNFGNAIRDQGKAKAAMPSYNQVAKLLNPIPDRPKDHNLILRAAAWDRANALGQQKRHAEAIRQWQSALKLDDGTEGPNLVLFLAADESEANLQTRPGSAGDARYEAAAANARANVAAKKTREHSQEERYTRRALELLKQAQAAGWFRDPQRIEQMKAEKSFDSLAGDEFKRFLENLDAKLRKKDRPGKE